MPELLGTELLCVNDGEKIMIDDSFGPVIFLVLFWPTFHIPILIWLIFWKDPLSSMSRLRIYDRRSMRIRTKEIENPLTIRRGFYIDRERYVALRRSYLGMKMDYEPTEDKIEHLLNRLEKILKRRRDEYQRGLIKIDRDILMQMKQELSLGDLKIDNYIVGYEETKSSWLRHRSVRSALIWAFVCAVPMLIPPLFMTGSWLPIAGSLASENVLRRSRDKKTRRLAKFAQGAIIVGTFWCIILLPVLYFVGWFRLWGIPIVD